MPRYAGCNKRISKEGVMTYRNTTWDDFYYQGIQYMRTVEKSLVRQDIFTPVIIYNISSMAIEKILMGVFILHGELPFCHTLSGMAGSAKNIIGLDDQLIDDMTRMAGMQSICSVDDDCSSVPGCDDVPFFIDVMKRVFVKTELYLKSGDWHVQAAEKYNNT